jgi:DNA replication protein DnaC
MALCGSSGSGKTYTALNHAKELGRKVCLIDTEYGSASKYADKFDFYTIQLETFAPETYSEAIRFVESKGYDVLIIDSISHAWMGKDGALEQVDKAAKRSQSNNSYVAWREVTPKHNDFVAAMLACKMHLIVTMRSKTEYVMEQNDKGKTVPKKVGLAPIQRDGIEYEFDIVGDMDLDHNLIITKTRCSELSGELINKPGHDLAVKINN